jgi:hypothetical protein
MKNNYLKNKWFLLWPLFIITGCYRNETNYYLDAEDKGIAIFSNTGNNLLTCFIDGKPWRTGNRTSGGFISRPRYEVDIVKQITNSLQDTLMIIWSGYFPSDSLNGYLTFIMPVAKNFSYKDFSALQGRRLQVDTTNGNFSTAISSLNTGNTKGSGSIYFHTARLDSIGPNTYSGKMSGLIEADFISFKITKGRFDHTIESPQVLF